MSVFEFQVSMVRFRVSGFGFQISGSGCRVSSSGGWGAGFWNQGSRVLDGSGL